MSHSRFGPRWVRTLLPCFLIIGAARIPCAAATLESQPAPADCGITSNVVASPAAAANRIPDSQVAGGSRNIAWAWLGSPTNRYAHDALGSPVHAASLHVLLASPDGSHRQLTLTLPPDRVFEDRVPRLVDLDGDGRDEIVLVESDQRLGSSLVVYGLRLGAAARQPVLAQLARSPFIGTANRWLNPAGTGDFHGDGLLDIAAVTTPHIGGVLTLYRYRPPVLEPVARQPGVSNHRIGSIEQQLSAVLRKAGQRDAVIVPASDFRSLRVLRLDVSGAWKDQAPPLPLAAAVQRIAPLPSGACVVLTTGATLRVGLRE